METTNLNNQSRLSKRREYHSPFCKIKSDVWGPDGDCNHNVFTYETCNFEYLGIAEDFEKKAIKILRDLGYKLDSLPCPFEPWASDDNHKEMPDLEEFIPGLIIKRCDNDPTDYWLYYVGFYNDDEN